MTPRPARMAPETAPETATETAAAFAAYLARDRFGALDGLRFFCIAAVLWHHSPLPATFGPGLPLLALPFRGFLGVDFFFVLSGFLITTLLLREEAAFGGFSLAAFYQRRALRILPVYGLTIALAAAPQILLKGQWDYLQLLPFYLLFLANFLPYHIPLLDPTWSLAVEEQFYLLWPLALRLVPRRIVLPVLGLLVALNVAGIMGALAPLGLRAFALGPLTIALPNATYAPILMGSGLALVLRHPAGFALAFRLLRGRATAAVLAVLLLVLVAVLPADLRGLPNLAIHLTMTAILAALVLREDGWGAGLLRLGPVARIGAISYGIYLYHLFALHLANVVLTRLGLDQPWPVLGLYAALSCLAAEISFRTWEAWFRRFRPKPRTARREAG